MRRFSPRELKRMMDRMGMSTQSMPEVKEVIFRTADKELAVQNPSVTVIEVQGQKLFQVVGEGLEERALPSGEPQSAKAFQVPDEDVQLVAQQAGVSLEEARRALEETQGNLAQAILLLTSRKQ
ncbi:nascent polypeptide-associated complex protein [Candidatus Hecatella orcuttiae]|uniref:nascent polypeptide-associated complex protein n=1 Tax=Candidatus Hecatella orcuttiae TaxID=1935119 RepID=UPI002867B698|nr:nascent polypeptide-associated complex protein [Candidatus Hecatella orcuttiae]